MKKADVLKMVKAGKEIICDISPRDRYTCSIDNERISERTVRSLLEAGEIEEVKRIYVSGCISEIHYAAKRIVPVLAVLNNAPLYIPDPDFCPACGSDNITCSYDNKIDETIVDCKDCKKRSYME